MVTEETPVTTGEQTGKKQQFDFAKNQNVILGALAAVLGPLASKDVTLVISADAQASHQSVVNAMEAARRTGLSQITFATQSSESSGS